MVAERDARVLLRGGAARPLLAVERALELRLRLVAREGEHERGRAAFRIHAAADRRRAVDHVRLGRSEGDDRPLVGRDRRLLDRELRIDVHEDLERVRAERQARVRLRRRAGRGVAAVERAHEDAPGLLFVGDEGERGVAVGRLDVRAVLDEDERRDAADLPAVLGRGEVDVAGGVLRPDEQLVLAEAEVGVGVDAAARLKMGTSASAAPSSAHSNVAFATGEVNSNARCGPPSPPRGRTGSRSRAAGPSSTGARPGSGRPRPRRSRRGPRAGAGPAGWA